ncbi:MAG: ROK family protein [Acidobacteria bacterium]|nr:MAG: ROK family protein [Acidobacteriota bacterium]
MTETGVCYVGVDLGGTSLRALVADDAYKTLGVKKIRTPVTGGPARLIHRIATLVESTLKEAGITRSRVRAVSVGAPGPIDRSRGIVEEAPNLGWKRVPLRAELRQMLRVPVFVENDVNVGLVGEHVLGAGRGAKNVVGIFVGTGIGGALILDGKLYEGSRGGAGEIGHTVLMVNGPLCGCGRRGCAEALASRTAMERDVRAAIKNGRKSSVLKIMKKKNKERMTSSIIVAALKKNDLVMNEVLQRAQFHLGILASNAVNLLDPECVVFGGGIVERLKEAYVGPIRETAYQYFLRPEDRGRVRIVPGKLGDNAGVLGAIVLAKQRLL